jgi:hypothetical protein
MPPVPVFPQDPNDIRGPIESTYNKTRDDAEKQYIQHRNDLEDTYRNDLRANEENKRNDLVAAGLNPDGSTPSDYTPGAPSPG